MNDAEILIAMLDRAGIYYRDYCASKAARVPISVGEKMIIGDEAPCEVEVFEILRFPTRYKVRETKIPQNVYEISPHLGKITRRNESTTMSVKYIVTDDVKIEFTSDGRLLGFESCSDYDY